MIKLILKISLISIYVLGFPAQELFGQEESPVVKQESKIDSTRLFSDLPVKSPLGAVLRSAVLPGWGQFYNESYIKAGVALAVNGALIGAILYNNQKWQSEGDVSFRDTRNTYLWIWGLTYLITLADAYVDANLYGFDEVMGVSYLPPQKDRHPGMLSFSFHF